MGNVVKILLGMLVVLAIVAGITLLRSKAPAEAPYDGLMPKGEVSAEQLQASVDSMRAKAEASNPDMAKTDALKAYVATESAKQFDDMGARERAFSAASMFWGFDYMNVRARADYCRQRGVDLTPFVTAFLATHRLERERSRAVAAAEGVDLDQQEAKVREVIMGQVEQDMKDVALGAQIPVEKTCDLFNENAEQLAAFIQLPPHVKTALMAQ
ncbi:hypothetical protein [Pseudoxanthomonas sp. PXM01]|uniref:hypothetical protein n=1 Tax=Pseudoxanthomonas sp. PXM01 TaxID=2769295 RepID=UPI001784B8F5|nr:hypothetical protein [Pseudoxanthomonas sp. PXM01]MBD9470196.1 hypothetical protein [Pseudoxanthomonas sp. PXM01]